MEISARYDNYIPDKAILSVGFWSGLIAFFAVLAFGVIQTLQVLHLITFPITKPNKQFWSHAAVLFTVMYVMFVTANYVVQLATVIPMTVKGRSGEIAILKQTPHSVFWNLDAIRYIAMGFATLFALPVFKKTGFQKWVKYTFLAHSLTTPLIAFVYFYPAFSNKLLLIATPWAVTAPLSMLLLALLFRKIANTPNP